MITVTLPKIFQPYYCNNLVRLGKNHDGGYLVNEQDILKTKTLLSFGIGEDWSFEEQFTDLNDCPLIAYDGTLKIDEVKENENLYTKYKDFFKDKKTHIEKNVGNNSFETSFNSVIVGDEIFLKCDIEGAEYRILHDILIHSKLFTGMVIEFHAITKPENYNSLTNFISKIDQKLAHIHINNYFYYKTDKECIPDIVELTFTSSSNLELHKNISLPNNLDMRNNPEEDEFKINF